MQKVAKIGVVAGALVLNACATPRPLPSTACGVYAEAMTNRFITPSMLEYMEKRCIEEMEKAR